MGNSCAKIAAADAVQKPVSAPKPRIERLTSLSLQPFQLPSSIEEPPAPGVGTGLARRQSMAQSGLKPLRDLSVVKVALFSCCEYDKASFVQAMGIQHTDTPAGYSFEWIKERLEMSTVNRAKGYQVICIFVNDVCDREVVVELYKLRVRAILLRCGGFDNVDLNAAAGCKISVAHVPSYSPEAVAEHSVALVQGLNRRLREASERIRAFNFSLDGLGGFNLHGKTVGIIGVGKIGAATARIYQGYGCNLIGFNRPGSKVKVGAGFESMFAAGSLDELLRESDIVTLHLPLDASNVHMVNSEFLTKLKRGAILCNTSRGKQVDTVAALDALDSGHLAGLALDVYEGEKNFFFKDLSGADNKLKLPEDDVMARLLAHPNCILTGHQAFLTDVALLQIASTTLDNLKECIAGELTKNELTLDKVDPIAAEEIAVQVAQETASGMRTVIVSRPVFADTADVFESDTPGTLDEAKNPFAEAAGRLSFLDLQTCAKVSSPWWLTGSGAGFSFVTRAAPARIAAPRPLAARDMRKAASVSLSLHGRSSNHVFKVSTATLQEAPGKSVTVARHGSVRVMAVPEPVPEL